MHQRHPNPARSVATTLALVASSAFVWGCPDAPPAGVAQPRPTVELAHDVPRQTVATSPSPPSVTASGTPLDAAAIAALAEQLGALHARQNPSPEPLPDLPDRSCAESFCVRIVDDTADPLRKLVSSPLLGDVRLVETSLSTGLPGGERVARLQILAPPSSSPAALGELARLAAPYLPPKRELAWGASVDPDGHPVVASYLLGPAVIDASDVASAERARFDGGAHAVTVVLHPEGAKRFGDVTGKMLHRRVAIMSAGRVQTAPIVQSPIPGGRISVSFPSEAEASAFQRLLPGKR